MSFPFKRMPIRHPAWLEADNSSKVTLAPKDEDTREEGLWLSKGSANSLIYFGATMCDLFQEASEFVHLFQGVVHQAMAQLFVLQLVVAAYDHARHCK